MHNDRVVATNLMGDEAVFDFTFSSYLLVKAVEIETPDDESIVDPDWGYTSVDCMDESLVYTGTWNNDSNSAFDAGTAKYTSEENASVEFTFAGTAIRWYGQKDSNFGSAEVYLDGQLVETVSVSSSSMLTNQLLFEAVGLSETTHTIKIVRASAVIDIDRFAYVELPPEVVYTKVDATSESITYVGDWSTTYNEEFYNGDAKYTAAEGAYAEFTFEGTAIQWCGQTSHNFGRADVYLDGVLVAGVVVYAEPAIGFLGWHDCKAKNIRLQRQTFCTEEKELTKAEYLRLLEASRKNEQLNLVLQTICGTGIRVSELRYFTVEAVMYGEIVVNCKSKTRTILVPGKLRKLLLNFAKQRHITSGAVFIGKSGKPLDRSNIWRQMKQLCQAAGVKESKVFPHNLRKLFARTFYGIEKDIAKLADILGHSSINTTRIYIMTTGIEHRRKIERLGLVV